VLGISQKQMRLINKTAIITGGGSGIGKGIALAFAREGAKVAIAGRTKDKLDSVAAEIGPNCLTVQADVGNPEDIRRLIETAVAHFGGLNVLVNNAALLLPGTAESHNDADWEQTFKVNVRGLWLMCRAALPHLRAAGGGSIINIGSVLSMVAARNRVAYSSSKGAVLSMTRAMALDHAAEKVRVNCICPGIVETEMVARFSLDENARRQRIAWHPMGRFGQPEDIAQAAIFLASDESAWMTGTAFPVDGGYTAQ
jgi:meso-butanediol dehydrogenase / (S,S)-butanediol dehydrogenase / diacetyl reductase